jgi:hypothetical protein
VLKSTFVLIVFGARSEFIPIHRERAGVVNIFFISYVPKVEDPPMAGHFPSFFIFLLLTIFPQCRVCPKFLQKAFSTRQSLIFYQVIRFLPKNKPLSK